MSEGRDLYGYGDQPPAVRWPGAAGLAVSVVLNIEEGAELNLADGDERNEACHEVTNEIRGAPDLCQRSHFGYGARVGYWRVTRLLREAGVPLTLNVCARALQATPWVADDAQRHGFEIMCHGWRWEAHAGMALDDERELIERALRTIREITGRTPLGWHTKSSPSINTRRLIVQAGLLYDSDAYDDELPYWVPVEGRPHLVLPYAFDTNDMRFFDSHAYVSGNDFADYGIDTANWLLQEARHSPRMMSIGLHTRIIGRPGRIAGLQRLIAHLRSQPGVWFATREQIARHWMAVCPPPSGA